MNHLILMSDSTILFMIIAFTGLFLAFLMIVTVDKSYMHAWRDGYDTAKETYADWNKGFSEGWDAMSNVIKEQYHPYKNKKDEE